MSSAIAKIANQVERHPGFIRFMAFFSWWREQLIAGLPDRWKQKISVEPERISVFKQDQQWVLLRESDQTELVRVDDDGSDLVRATLHGSLNKLDEANTELWHSFPASACLHKQLILPAAAEENLDQVLRFEMDRHTPFKADEVAFDWHIVERYPDTKKIKLELVIAPKQQIDTIAQSCQDKGLRLRGINLKNGEEGTSLASDINLLPAPFRSKKNRRQLIWNVLLVALFVGLLQLVLWLSVNNRQQAINDYEEQVDTLREQSREVISLRERIKNAEDSASFLSTEKQQQPMLLDLVAEVTRLLPDEAWLQRFQVNNGKVQLSGQSPDTSALIGLLQQSKIFCNPSTRGTVSNDPKTGNERFTIEITLNNSEDGECNGTVASR